MMAECPIEQLPEIDSMRQEPLFSRSGYYRYLLDINVLLHREAATATRESLEDWRLAHPSGSTVRVLDLACGGLPLTIAEVMAGLPELCFDYTGVDINPDQVEAAREFTFPVNVLVSRILAGNAWDLDALGLPGGFDLVYSGMNLHHGTPEEIHFLGLQLRRLLARPGLFISHDVYRPDGTLYRRRPDTNPGKPSESWRLVPPERLREAGVPPAGLPEDLASHEPEWRLDYLRRMLETLRARGGDPGGAESTVEHMRERDYPISQQELLATFSGLGFRVSGGQYDAQGEPMAPYVAFCAAGLVEPDAA
jgi:hypothetical protein